MSPTPARTTARAAAVTAGIGAAASLGLGAFVARRLLFPSPYTALATVLDSDPDEVTLAATRDTRLPGTYRLLHGDTAVRVDAVLTGSASTGTGTERAGTDAVRRHADGRIATGTAEWDALLYDDVDDVPGTEADGVATTHVLHVPGQSLGPQQVLRGIGVWRSLGATSGIVDCSDLPLRALDAAAPDRIVERVRAARTAGATRVVLQGWSAGALACSVAAARTTVDGIVGVAPLLDVRSALRGAVAAAHLPRTVGSVAARIATTPGLSRLAGAARPVDAAAWRDTGTPTLLVHSRADDFVAPVDVAARDARVVTFDTAPHTLEWNEDPERWDAAVRSFATDHGLAVHGD